MGDAGRRGMEWVLECRYMYGIAKTGFGRTGTEMGMGWNMIERERAIH